MEHGYGALIAPKMLRAGMDYVPSMYNGKHGGLER
jgi:hypothetical protein